MMGLVLSAWDAVVVVVVFVSTDVGPIFAARGILSEHFSTTTVHADRYLSVLEKLPGLCFE